MIRAQVGPDMPAFAVDAMALDALFGLKELFAAR